MQLTVVGSAAAWSRQPCHASSCYLVEHDGRALVLDMGQGTFAEINRYRDPGTLDAVLISHLHADHMVDLVPLRHFVRYGDAQSPPQLRGPIELRQRFGAFAADAGFLDGLPGEPLHEGRFELAGFDVEARHVTHIPDSYAFRLTAGGGSDGRGLVYSGDCAVADDLLPLIRRGDTLVCEAYYGAGEPGPMHLNAAQAAGVAARAGAGRLVLTHVREGTQLESLRAVESAFQGELLIAEPGLILEVG
jgi:ribonuclease BN (tRNA processing enzyme)